MKFSPEQKRKLAIISAILMIILGLVAGIAIIGNEARLVDVIILYITGVGCGASLVKAIAAVKLNSK